MADRKKPKPKKEKKRKNGEETLTKEEKAVANYVRFNCPTKTTIFAGNEVHYFKASDAISSLQKSKWATGKRGNPVLFGTNNNINDYMNRLMGKGLFWRARKLVPKRKEKVADKEKLTDKDEPAKITDKEEPETSKAKGGELVEASPKKAKKAASEAVSEAPEEEEKKEKKKKSKKVKLEFQSDQSFYDSGLGSDVFVWHYDPSSWTQYAIGFAIVLGSIGMCLFPLWPDWLRLGVYYLSVLAMVFVGVLIGLIVLRSIVFGVVWAVTVGKHHLWILPNLTEDCGFFESFKPYYDHKFYPSKKEKEEADAAKAAAIQAKADAEEEEEEEGAEEEDGEGSGGEEGADLSQDDDDASATEPSAPNTPDQGHVRQRKGRRVENSGFELVDPPAEEE